VELGNEPDLYPKYQNITIPPAQLAKDFAHLRQTLYENQPQVILAGPDMATLGRYNYFSKFMQSVQSKVLSAVTFHHYYGASDTALLKDFVSIDYLDKFIYYCSKANSIISEAFEKKVRPPVWLGETSSTYGGGSPTIGQTFAAGFLWMDKLGVAAQSSVSLVVRQALKGGYYSLLDENMKPNPDYWTSVLYRRLVGTKVLNSTGFLEMGRSVRAYAHCTHDGGNSGAEYSRGSVVFMILNMGTKSAEVTLSANDTSASTHDKIDQYLFEPVNGELMDSLVRLNGRKIKMADDTTLPSLAPVKVSQPLVVPPLTYGYFVAKSWRIPACT